MPHTPTHTSKSRALVNALLWLFSGFIILAGLAVLEFIAHFVFASTTSSTNPVMTVINIVSILGGLLGVLMIPAGIVIGCIKLSRL